MQSITFSKFCQYSGFEKPCHMCIFGLKKQKRPLDCPFCHPKIWSYKFKRVNIGLCSVHALSARNLFFVCVCVQKVPVPAFWPKAEYWQHVNVLNGTLVLTCCSDFGVAVPQDTKLGNNEWPISAYPQTPATCSCTPRGARTISGETLLYAIENFRQQTFCCCFLGEDAIPAHMSHMPGTITAHMHWWIMMTTSLINIMASTTTGWTGYGQNSC